MPKKSKNSLTVVIPVGPGRSAEKALNSLKGQDCDVIVCGDGFLPDYPDVGCLKAPSVRSAGLTRNFAIRHVTTPWIGFLDDDDTVTPDYVQRFEEERGGCDVIIFRMEHPQFGLIPKIPQIEWGNVGISFCVSTAWAKQIPFIKEKDDEGINEDYQLLADLEQAGAKIHFSEHIVYKVR